MIQKDEEEDLGVGDDWNIKSTHSNSRDFQEDKDCTTKLKTGDVPQNSAEDVTFWHST